MNEKLTRSFQLGIERTTDPQGRLHNPDGPAVVNQRSNHKEWYNRGLLHRDGDEPAVLGEGYSSYYKHGKLHRDGGQPAIISKNGNHLEWYVNGQRHRDRNEGPAVFIRAQRQGFADEQVYFENGIEVQPGRTPILDRKDAVIEAAVKVPELPPVISAILQRMDPKTISETMSPVLTPEAPKAEPEAAPVGTPIPQAPVPPVTPEVTPPEPQTGRRRKRADPS